MPTDKLFTELEIQSILNYGEDRKRQEDVIRRTYDENRFNISPLSDGSNSVKKKESDKKLRPHSLASYQEDIVADKKDPEGLFFSKAMVLGALTFFGFVVLVILFLAIQSLDAITAGQLENSNSLSGLSWLSGCLGIVCTTTAGVALSAVIA